MCSDQQPLIESSSTATDGTNSVTSEVGYTQTHWKSEFRKTLDAAHKYINYTGGEPTPKLAQDLVCFLYLYTLYQMYIVLPG